MKLVRWHSADQPPTVGLLTPRGVVPVPLAQNIEEVIERFTEWRGELEQLAQNGAALAPESVRLLAPLPRPGKILCSTAAYGPVDGDPPPLLMTLKSAESV